jgi:hypothetical protein
MSWIINKKAPQLEVFFINTNDLSNFESENRYF